MGNERTATGKCPVFTKMKRLNNIPGMSALLPTLILMVLLSLTTDTFLSSDNIMNIFTSGSSVCDHCNRNDICDYNSRRGFVL